jgi:5'-nucleotidase
VRILVTNDDGVHAPGLAALTRALARWAEAVPDGGSREVIVVAPMANHSGASAAVGTVYERESIAYQSVSIPGAGSTPAFGLDASPALSVIVGGLGGFGPAPDLIFSGINLGVNVGRSVLHSGTVGAVLTGAQLGISGLAVSLRSNVQPECWDTAAALAVSLIDELAAAPARSVLNLNVPSVPLGELRGVRRGHIGSAGIIKETRRFPDSSPGDPAAASGGVASGGVASGGVLLVGPVGGPTSERGEVRLRLGTAVPSLGDVGDEAPGDDGSLLGAGFASLTPLVGVHEAAGDGADELIRRSLEQARRLIGR